MDRRVCLTIGWYNRFNAGDESYKLTFPVLFPDYDFRFGEKGPADICILGGGNILSENYVRLALNVEAGKRFVFSASASKNSPFELLKEFDEIIVRDKTSEQLLLDNGVSCRLGADAAFCMKPDPIAGRQLIQKMFDAEGLHLYSKIVGVVLNGHLGQAKDAQLARDFITLNRVAQDIAATADVTPASFVFFPMSTGSPHDDRATNAMVASRCKFWNKNLMIYERLSVQQTLDLISACDATISTRLHSTIFSLIANVPFVDLVHHDKNRSFLQTCNLEEYSLSYWSFGSYQLKTLLNKVLSGHVDLTEARTKQEQLLRESLKYVRFDQSTGCDTSSL
jgi:polysaccharide pyruvyl transferase WcaK-like protein